METLSRTRPHHLIMAPPKSLSEGLIGREASSSLDQLLGRRNDKGPGRKKAGPWRGMNVQV